MMNDLKFLILTIFTSLYATPYHLQLPLLENMTNGEYYLNIIGVEDPVLKSEYRLRISDTDLPIGTSESTFERIVELPHSQKNVSYQPSLLQAKYQYASGDLIESQRQFFTPQFGIDETLTFNQMEKVK